MGEILEKIDVVILCGGSGTRLWPMSRTGFPKQFIKLIDRDQSLFQSTVLRALKLNPKSLTIIVNLKYDFIVKEQMEEIKVSNYTLVSEPKSKNSAPAIATACNILSDNSTVLVLASDHIWDDDKFVDSVIAGTEYVDKGFVFFIIKPLNPHTGYGYVKFDGNRLIKFVEKPNYDQAINFIQEGDYYWNSGVFLFKNCMMKDEFLIKHPDILFHTKNAIVKDTDDHIRLRCDEFSKVDNISIDYAIMESYNNGYVVMYNGFWSDVGSYDSIHNYLPKDENDNVIDGDVEMIDTKNCYIKTTDRVVATIGMSNTIIVDTKDALLVADIYRCQEIKNIVPKINGKYRDAVDFRPWGWCEVLSGDDNHKVKRIHIYCGMTLPLQSHKRRSEHWIVIRGIAKVQINDKVHILNEGDHILVEIDSKYRIENIGKFTLELIETQIGDYFGDDDILLHDNTNWDWTDLGVCYSL